MKVPLTFLPEAQLAEVTTTMKTSQDLRLKADYTGIHRDSQGSSLKDGFTGFCRFPNFVHFMKQKSPQIKKLFSKKVLIWPKS